VPWEAFPRLDSGSCCDFFAWLLGVGFPQGSSKYQRLLATGDLVQRRRRLLGCVSLVIPGTCRIIAGVKFPALVAGRFVRRDNRFRVIVEIAGERVAAHLPNSGRLTELLTPNRLCWLTGFDTPRRKTRFDLTLMEYAGTLVSVDARLPNALFAEAWATGQLEPFRGYDCVDREVRLGESRLDFRLSGPDGVCWVEVKSVTLVEEGVARFPDAPTARGVRHLGEQAQEEHQPHAEPSGYVDGQMRTLLGSYPANEQEVVILLRPEGKACHVHRVVDDPGEARDFQGRHGRSLRLAHSVEEAAVALPDKCAVGID